METPRRNQDIWTPARLESVGNGRIFATGVFQDSFGQMLPNIKPIYLLGTGAVLPWVAVKELKGFEMFYQDPDEGSMAWTFGKVAREGHAIHDLGMVQLLLICKF